MREPFNADDRQVVFKLIREQALTAEEEERLEGLDSRFRDYLSDRGLQSETIVAMQAVEQLQAVVPLAINALDQLAQAEQAKAELARLEHEANQQQELLRAKGLWGPQGAVAALLGVLGTLVGMVATYLAAQYGGG